jgi:hypothetical protein
MLNLCMQLTHQLHVKTIWIRINTMYHSLILDCRLNRLFNEFSVDLPIFPAKLKTLNAFNFAWN